MSTMKEARFDSKESADDFAAWIMSFNDDPYEWVLACYPWGEPGRLDGYYGPDVWQAKVLKGIRDDIRNNKANIRICTSSGHGCGKQLVDSERVFMSDTSMKEVRDLKRGDKIIGGDGHPCRVVGVYPQGVKKLYRVTFSDSTSILAGDEHQWAVKSRLDRTRRKRWRVMTTSEISHHIKRSYTIPVCGPVQWPERRTRLHPYVVGYLLANGATKHGTKTISVSSPDKDIIERLINLLPPRYGIKTKYRGGVYAGSISKKGDFNGGINTVYRRMRFMGKCEEKKIPNEYLHNSVENRLELLRGLMDGDGCCATRKGRKGMRCVYSTSSPHLRDQMIYLVRSLGGISGYCTDDRRGKRINVKGSIGVTRLVNYQLSINLPNTINPFCCERKKTLYAGWIESGIKMEPQRFIRSIEFDREASATCIAVDNEDSLYLAGDFIVTHNTALVAWIIHWFISTHPHPQIVVTANTGRQLTDKTWRELKIWQALAINGWQFEHTATMYRFIGEEATWFAAATKWSAHNSEAFAGTHERNVMILFDEASGIDDIIWEVAAGAFTSHGGLWLTFGNPTRNTGRFYEAAFGRHRKRWDTYVVDARTALMRNDELIQEWKEDWGEDSDYFRVRVRGLPPKQGPLQFISSAVVHNAVNRHIETTEISDRIPLLMGFDVARQGNDASKLVLRHGRKVIPFMDGEAIQTYRIRDITVLCHHVSKQIVENNPDIVFVDGTGIGAGAVDYLRMLGHDNIVEVHGGEEALDKKVFLNKRVEMWDRMRMWCDVADIPDDPQLIIDLTTPEFGFQDKSQKIKLESKEDMKKRGADSPDSGDALALTFYHRVPSKGVGTESSAEPDVV